MPTQGAYEWFTETAEERAPAWENEVTLRSVELLTQYDPVDYVERISPTPLLMVVAEQDDLVLTDEQLEAYDEALEPKELVTLDGGHFDAYDIQDVEIGKAVPPSVTGSATVTQRCSGGEGRVQFYVDGEFAGEEVVEINCVEEATATFEYSPDRPLKPGTYELRVAVLVGTADLVIDETTIEFQVPSGRGRGKGRSKGKGR